MKLPFSFLAGSRPAKDPYAVLGLSPGASLQEVEEAYLHLWRYWNPESNPLPGAAARHRAVLRAGKELLAAPKPVPSGSPSWKKSVPSAIAVLLILLSAGTLILVLRSQPAATAPSSRQAVSQTPSSTRPVPAPEPSPVRDPASLTVGLTELPSGYQLVRAGPAATTGPGQPVPSWDAVFLRGTSDLSNYQVAESMVIVYATTDGAHAGFDEQAARGPGAGQIPVSLGDESVGWTELAPSFPGLKIVRLTFRIGSLLAQVVLLGPAGSQVQEDALGLSVIQVERLKANGS